MEFFTAVNQERLLLFAARLAVLLTTMPIHEFAHGWVAHRLGDDTAKNLGRLHLNPLRHLEPVGTLLILFTGFGWAKPVPVNPANFKRIGRRGGMALTALAGPLANLILAFLIMIFYQFFHAANFAGSELLLYIAWTIISVNVMLAMFNLLPVPPLDGYNILAFLLPAQWEATIARYQRFIFGGLFLLLFFTPVLDLPLRFLGDGMLRVLFELTKGVRLLAGLIV